MPIYVMMSVSTLRPKFGQSGRLLRRFGGRVIHRHAAADDRYRPTALFCTLWNATDCSITKPRKKDWNGNLRPAGGADAGCYRSFSHTTFAAEHLGWRDPSSGPMLRPVHHPCDPLRTNRRRTGSAHRAGDRSASASRQRRRHRSGACPPRFEMKSPCVPGGLNSSSNEYKGD
jgi:hypothetical protein